MPTEQHTNPSRQNSLKQLKQSIYRNGPLLGVISAIGGFIADVLQPIAPFSEYILYLSMGLGILAIGGYLVIARVREQALTLLIFALLACGISGLLLSLQYSEEAEQQGLLAATIPGIQSLQESLGLMQQDIDHLVTTTDNIQSSVNNIENQLQTITDASDGGIISNPDTPEEHYHNARLHELGGDYGNARRSYADYFRQSNISNAPAKLDPHLRFQKFLKIQEGLAGARELYFDQFGESERFIDQYALILLAPATQRKSRLVAFSEQHADFAPVFYELAREHSEARVGQQTLADKRAEQNYLQTFDQIAQNGGLNRYFIDVDALNKMLSYAEKRLTALQQLNRNSNPITFTPQRHNSGWNIIVHIAEPTSAIYYQRANDQDYLSTGSGGSSGGGINPATGQPMPRMFFELPKHAQAQTILVKYTDANGNTQGPFDYVFEPQAALIANQIELLEITKASWVDTQTFDQQNLVYFTHLLSYRCGIQAVRYGINRDQPDQTFALPPCNPADPYAVEGTLYIEAPKSLKNVVVELTYLDGRTSTIETFLHAP